MNRRDYLGDCNEHKVALADFHEQFCKRCTQPECSRSQFGTTKFEQRVSTWKERLITAVPVMPSQDPRFIGITAKQFKSIEMGPIPEVVGWVNPKEESPRPVADPAPSLVKLPVLMSEEAPVPTFKVPEGGLNTPSPPPTGIILTGAPRATPTAKDAWTAPAPKQPPGAPVVKKGATIRFGGGSGVE